MKNKVNYLEYEQQSGETVAMSTAPILLLSLRNKNSAAYKKLSKGMLKGVDDEDCIAVYEFLYNAYLNANQDEKVMTFTEFIEDANQDWSYNVELMGEMIQPTKKQPSEQPLSEQ